MKAIFTISFPEQEEALKSLLRESRERPGFYLLLGVATFVVTLALVIGSWESLICGALMAPLLYPVLSLSLAVVTSSRLALYRSLKVLLRSLLFIVAMAAASAFLFSAFLDEVPGLTVRPSLPVFMIAFAAGLAVAYSWVKHEFSAALPGVAMTVSLLPPLVGVGAGLAWFNYDLISQSLLLLLINWLGVIGAAVIVFSLFGFSPFQQEEEEKIKEEAVERRIQASALAESSGAAVSFKNF